MDRACGTCWANKQTNKHHLSEKLTGDVGKIYENERYIELEFKPNKISGCGLNSTSFRTESNGKLL